MIKAGMTVMSGASMNITLCRRGGQLFFEDQLDRIRDRLQQALPTGAVGTDAHLDARQHPALDTGEIGKPHGQEEHQDNRLYEPFQDEARYPLFTSKAAILLWG